MTVVDRRDARLERLVEVHVLLAVDDEHQRISGGMRPTAAAPSASNTGTTANTGGANSPDS